MRRGKDATDKFKTAPRVVCDGSGGRGGGEGAVGGEKNTVGISRNIQIHLDRVGRRSLDLLTSPVAGN